MLRKVLYGMVASAVLALLPGIALAQGDTAQPVDPPQQVAQLRQQFEGLTPQQVEAKGFIAEGPCVPSPHGAGAMGIHAINRQLYQEQFPKGEMDPNNPPVLLLGPSDEVIGVEWEAKDVGQGPMKMFGQTICEQQRFCAPGVGWSCLFDGARTAGLAVGRYWNAGSQGRASGLMIRIPF
jgi:hypothetical protein